MRVPWRSELDADGASTSWAPMVTWALLSAPATVFDRVWTVRAWPSTLTATALSVEAQAAVPPTMPIRTIAYRPSFALLRTQFS